MNAAVISIFLQLQNPSAEAKNVEIPRGSRVLLLGDSLAQGMAAPFKSIAKKNGYKPIIHAKDGTRCDQWSVKIEHFMSKIRPKLVIISLGTNDSVLTKPEWERKHIKKLKNKVKAYGGKLLWLMPPSLPDRIKGKDIVKKMLLEEIPPEDIFNTEQLNPEKTKDKIHMTKKGYETWITAAWNELTGKGILIQQKE